MMKRKPTRREALGLMGLGGVALTIGCGGNTVTSADTTATAPPPDSATGSSCAVTPSETAGPFPSVTDMVRSDIREGKAGTVLRLTIKVVNASSGCGPVPGASVEIWHVDALGNYSQYGSQAAQTYLRGIQTTDAGGNVTFTTIYPGWYQGRATHIHVEVSVGGRSVKVSQIAFPESTNDLVHRSGPYAPRGTNPRGNAADGIFADSLAQQLTTPTGDPTSGYAATFTLGVAI